MMVIFKLKIYPTKRNLTVRFSRLVPILMLNANCHEILISDHILLKLKYVVDEYLWLPIVRTGTINAIGKQF